MFFHNKTYGLEGTKGGLMLNDVKRLQLGRLGIKYLGVCLNVRE
jgi:hypothetical protein